MKEGYIVKYNEGDMCFFRQNAVRFSSEIRFVCDHDEEEGWPMLTRNPDNPCHFVFQWRTKLACRHCLLKEVEKVVGPCDWSKREISYIPNEFCNIYPMSLVDGT